MTAAAFTTSINRLLAQIAHWQQARWSSPPPDDAAAARAHTILAARPGAATTRADLVFLLVQRLADLGAEAEHRERRPVPREADHTLPDQLRVMSADLLAADPPAALLTEAAAAVDATRQAFP